MVNCVPRYLAERAALTCARERSQREQNSAARARARSQCADTSTCMQGQHVGNANRPPTASLGSHARRSGRYRQFAGATTTPIARNRAATVRAMGYAMRVNTRKAKRGFVRTENARQKRRICEAVQAALSVILPMESETRQCHQLGRIDRSPQAVVRKHRRLQRVTGFAINDQSCIGIL